LNAALSSFAVLLCLAAGAAAAAERTLTILTGRGGSIYYTLGVALASGVQKTLPEVKASVEGTKGSIENLTRLQAGRADIAFASGDVLSEAATGNEDAGFKAPLDKLRGIAALYPDYIQIVARADAGIRTLADLKGKRVSVGARNSSDELNARSIFAAAGLVYSDFAAAYLPFGETMELMKDGRIDATLRTATAGAGALRDLASALDIVLVPVPSEVVERIGNNVYEPGVVPANTYRGQLEDVPVVAVRNYVVAREDLDSDTVYAVTRALWTGLDQMIAAHPAAKAIAAKRALAGMPIPLHPGAEQYYREVELIKPAKPPVNRRRG
jgi:hypothetical protein